MTLADLEINRNQSALWQREAAIPDKDRELYLAARRKARKEISSASFVRTFARRPKAQAKRPRSPHETLGEGVTATTLK